MFEKLRQHWKVNNWNLFLIISTFALGDVHPEGLLGPGRCGQQGAGVSEEGEGRGGWLSVYGRPLGESSWVDDEAEETAVVEWASEFCCSVDASDPGLVAVVVAAELWDRDGRIGHF